MLPFLPMVFILTLVPMEVALVPTNSFRKQMLVCTVFQASYRYCILSHPYYLSQEQVCRLKDFYGRILFPNSIK